MRSFFYIFLAGLLGIGCNDIKQQGKESVKADPAFQLADSITSGDFSGVILIASPGEQPAFFYNGYKNRAIQATVDPGDHFNIFSLGKSLTAAVIVKLAEEGKLSLDAPVYDYLPDLQIVSAKKITIRHLLSHTSGLGNYMSSENFVFNPSKEMPVTDLVSLIESQPLVFEEPGSRFAYSNSGYIILGAVIEAIEKDSYKNVLQKKILAPAGITNSFFSFDRTGQIQYYSNDSTESVLNAGFPASSSDGGLYMTAGDLLKFINLVYSDYFTEESRKEFFTPVITIDSRGGNRQLSVAASFFTYSFDNGYKVTGNNGGFPGLNAAFRVIRHPDGQKTIIIVLSNVSNGAASPVKQIERRVVRSI